MSDKVDRGNVKKKPQNAKKKNKEVANKRQEKTS